MKDDAVVAFRHPGSFSDDPLMDILRAGARQLLARADEVDVAVHIAAHADLTGAEGWCRVVRLAHLPEREIQTGVGAVGLKAPRVRDRDPEAPGGRIGFNSSLLLRHLGRTRSIEELLPRLSLKGISSGDFGEALAALPGPAGCARPDVRHHEPAEGALVGAMDCPAKARSVGQALRLLPGRRGLSVAPHGA